MANVSELPAVPAQSSRGCKPAKTLIAGMAAILLYAVLTGCGDTFRPVANPVLKPGGDPAPTHVAVVVSNNSGAAGMATVVDVSGDTNVGNFQVGRGAISAAFNPGTTQAVVANKGDDTVSVFLPLIQGSTVSTATLPAGSAPVALASSQLGTMYVANSGTNTVGVINTAGATLTTSIPVGRTPVAVAQAPGGGTLYSVNQGDGTVTAISPQLNSPITTIPVGASPVAAAINSDGKTLYVLNQGSATVSAIDVASNTLSATVPTGASPRFVIFDSRLRRLYVANSGSNTISVFNADTSLTPLATVGVGAGPVSIAPLLDGTRIYVANGGCADAVTLTGCSGNTVSVVDALSLAVRKTITVGSTPISLAADPGSTKVVVANRDSNTISDIRTSDDTVVNSVPAGAPQPSFVVIQ